MSSNGWYMLSCVTRTTKIAKGNQTLLKSVELSH